MSTNGCEHLDSFKTKDGVKTFQMIHAYFVVCSAPGSRKLKVMNFFCNVCDKSLHRLHSCLECVYFSCIDHIDSHYMETNHCLYVDLTFGHILCYECGDYVYDTELETIGKANEVKASQRENRQLAWISWKPTPFEQQLLKSHWKRVCITPQSTIGLRGLVNLGLTCFMNCIVQALMHTSVLRDYFLAERHLCKKTTGSCLMCEMSRLFQEFYKGARSPLSLHQMLYLIWTNTDRLAGYEQQDAHEFFIQTLDVLHRHCLEAMPPLETKPGKPYHCTCIIDQTFTGGLQSDIVCQNCKGVSTTFEPITAISLDVACSSLEKTTYSLNNCLEWYTRAEHLGNDVKIFCSNCESYQESTKQLTLKTLPVVISFHFKRIEYVNDIGQKNSTFISFPEIIDMTPFLSASNRTDPNTGNSLLVDNRYSLFAVVNHCGDQTDAGHYNVYIRHQHEYWYKCNDDVITRAELKEVLESEGYLLFYHKHILEYE